MAKRLRNTRKKRNTPGLQAVRDIIREYWDLTEYPEAALRIERIAQALGNSLPFPEEDRPVLVFKKTRKKTLESGLEQYLKAAFNRLGFAPGIRFGNAELVKQAGHIAGPRSLHYLSGWLIFCDKGVVEVMPWAWNIHREDLLDVSWDPVLVGKITGLMGLKDPVGIARKLKDYQRDFAPIFANPPANVLYVGNITDAMTAQALADFWVRDVVDDLGFFNTTDNALVQATLGALSRLNREEEQNASEDIQKGTEGQIQDQCDTDGDGPQEQEPQAE